jgi:hypothetical protein
MYHKIFPMTIDGVLMYSIILKQQLRTITLQYRCVDDVRKRKSDAAFFFVGGHVKA